MSDISLPQGFFKPTKLPLVCDKCACTIGYALFREGDRRKRSCRRCKREVRFVMIACQIEIER